MKQHKPTSGGMDNLIAGYRRTLDDRCRELGARVRAQEARADPGVTVSWLPVEQRRPRA